MAIGSGKKSMMKIATECVLPSGHPPKPGYLNADLVASKKWDEIIVSLATMDRLGVYDGHVIEESAKAYSRMRSAEERCDRDGWELESGGKAGDMYKNPASRTYNENRAYYTYTLRMMGLTPDTRDRISPVQAGDDQDAFASFQERIPG